MPSSTTRRLAALSLAVAPINNSLGFNLPTNIAHHPLQTRRNRRRNDSAFFSSTQQPCEDDILPPIKDKIIIDGVEYTRKSEQRADSTSGDDIDLSRDDDIIRIDEPRGESNMQNSIRREEEASLPPIYYREDYIEESMMNTEQQIDTAEIYNDVYEELNSDNEYDNAIASLRDGDSMNSSSSSTVDQFWAWALRTSLPESRKTRKTRMQMFAYLSQPSKGCFCFAILIFNYFYDYI